jgi:Tfp pilus assembly protein PilV
MLAIVVLGAGLLTLAGSTAVTIRMAADGGVRTIAAGVAASIADSLRARPCDTIAGGSERSRGIDIAWTVATTPDARLVRITAAFDGAGRRRQFTLQAIAPCRTP